jgi:hypothetical protein
MPDLGTMDKLMMSIVSASESTSEDFSVGAVSKVDDKKVIKLPKESRVTETEGFDTDFKFLDDTITNSNEVLRTLSLHKKALISKVEALRLEGKFLEANNLRYAYKSIEYSIEDLVDSINLAKLLLNK